MTFFDEKEPLGKKKCHSVENMLEKQGKFVYDVGIGNFGEMHTGFFGKNT